MGRVLVRRRPPPTEIASGTPAVMTWTALDAGVESVAVAHGLPPNLTWQPLSASVDVAVAGPPASMAWSARDARAQVEVGGPPASMAWTALDAEGEVSVFDPATLTLAGWWRGYSGAPWSGTASAGTSGSNGASTLGSDPGTDTLNGHGVANFSASMLALAGTLNTYANTQAFSGWALVNVPASQTSVLLTDNDNGSANVYVLSDGIAYVDVYNGSDVFTAARAVSTSAWQLITWRYRNGGNVQIGVNEIPGAAGGAASVSTSINITPRTGTVVLGDAGAGTFKLAEMGIARAVLTDQNFTDVKSYINARYGLSL